MPRKKNPDAPPAPPTAREALNALPAEGLTGGQEFVQGSITGAVDLIEAKKAIQADLQQARDFLAYAVTSGQASPEQAAWVTAYLPKRLQNAADGSEA